MARLGARISPYLYFLPAFALLAVVLVYPSLVIIYQSFFNWSIISGQGAYVGLNNYGTALSNPQLAQSVQVTLTLTVMAVPIELFLGLGIALLLAMGLRGTGAVRTIILMPFLMAPVAAGAIWSLLVDPSSGLFNFILQDLHLPTYPFASNPSTVIPTLAMIDIWQWTPFFVILLYAALQVIPRRMYESAEVDGASQFRIFRSITLPWIYPMLLLALTFRIMYILRTFDTVVMVMGADGGPGGYGDVLAIYVWNTIWNTLQLGLTSALGVIVLILTIAVSCGFVWLLWRSELRV